MITGKDVSAAMEARWAASGLLSALVDPANVYADRVAERTVWPNARLKVAAKEPTRFGSQNYLRAFEVEVLVETLAGRNDHQAIAAALSDAFGGTNANPTAGLAGVPNGAVLHCLEGEGGTVPKQGKLARQAGDDFLRVTMNLDILVQGVF